MVTLCTCTMPSALWARPAFKCHSRLKPRNVLVGTLGKYEVSKGLAVIKRQGFINRRKHRVRRKCLITGIKAGQCVVMHFDRAAFRRAVTKNRKLALYYKLRLQCVHSDNPSKLVRQSGRGALITPMGTPWTTLTQLQYYQIRLLGPNKTGYASSKGTPSQRGAAHLAQLKKRNLIMKSFCVPRAATRSVAGIGKKIFCQWYHVRSNTVFFATEYTLEGPK